MSANTETISKAWYLNAEDKRLLMKMVETDGRCRTEVDAVYYASKDAAEACESGGVDWQRVKSVALRVEVGNIPDSYRMTRNFELEKRDYEILIDSFKKLGMKRIKTSYLFRLVIRFSLIKNGCAGITEKKEPGEQRKTGELDMLQQLISLMQEDNLESRSKLEKIKQIIEE